MKRWIIPAIAVGVAIFLLTERGRDAQDKVSSNLGDWVDKLLRINQAVQDKLQKAQGALEHFDRALHESQR
ncbi:MAG: hypothetical protein ACRD2E_11730 [Terriglobales bacterium]